MAMVVAAHHGRMVMVQADVLSALWCVDIASSAGGDGVISGWAGAGRTTKMIGRRSARRFGYSAAEAEAVSSSYSTSCRVQRMTITRSSRGSGRQEALRSRQQSNVVAGGAGADAMTGEEGEEAIGSFWDRLQLAWRVLIGDPNEAQVTKRRFSRLLVRDRGFNSANLSRLYNAAKGAIKEHVELEGDEDTEVTAVVDRLGELRLDFRVKRVKSVLRDEPFSDCVHPEMEPSLSISRDQLWDDSRASHDSEVLEKVSLDSGLPSSALPDMEPSLSIRGDQLWEYSRTPHDWNAHLGVALDRPIPNFVVSDGKTLVSTSGGQLREDNMTSQDLEVEVGVLDEPFPQSVLVDEEPKLSISGDQLWKDSTASEGLDDQLGRHSKLNASALSGALSEPFPNSILPDFEPIMSIIGNQLLDGSRVEQDHDALVEEASNLMSTMDVDSVGEWFTFSFTDSIEGQIIEEQTADDTSSNDRSPSL